MRDIAFGVCLVATATTFAAINPAIDRLADLPSVTSEWRSVGPGGGGWIQSIKWSSHQADRLYLGCDVGGFYWSDDFGKSWTMSNSGLTCLFIEDIAEHPENPDIIFLATPGGVMKSVDRGRNWQEKRKGFPAISYHSFPASVSKVVFRPGEPNTVYAPIGQPRMLDKGKRGEIYRSRDCGETWQQIVKSGLPKDLNVFDLSINFAKPDELLICSPVGVFISTDGGESWTPSNEGLPAHLRTLHLARAKSEPETVYVTLRQKGGEKPWSAGVYISHDGGRTWSARNDGLPQHAGRAGAADNFASWTKRISVSAKDPNRVYTGGASWVNTGIFASSDGGGSWKQCCGKGFDRGWITFWGPTCCCLAESELDPDRLAFGTSGMVYVTKDGGRSWKSAYYTDCGDGRISGAGLEVTCLHNINPSRHRRGKFYLGYYDIGLMVTEDDGRTMRRCVGGIPNKYENSCFAVAEAPDDPNLVWGVFGNWGNESGVVAKSTDGGVTWNCCTNTPGAHFDAATRNIAVFGSNGRYRLLYGSKLGLVVSKDGGESFELVSTNGFPAAKLVRSVAVDGNRIYAATSVTANGGGAVYLRQKGDGWKRLTDESMDIGEIKGIAADGDRVLVCARQHYLHKSGRMLKGGAFLSTDGGTTWKTVVKDHYVVSPHIAASGMYVSLGDAPYHDHCQGGGALRSTDNGATWHRLEGKGLHSPHVSVIATDPFAPSRVWLGTGGNSIFVSDVSAR